MGDDVVEFAGDRQALLGNATARLLVAGGFGLFGARLGLGGELSAVAHGVAEEDGGGDPAGVHRPARGGTAGAAELRGDGQEAGGGEREGDAGASRGLGAGHHGVLGDEDGGEHGERGVIAEEEEPGRGEGGAAEGEQGAGCAEEEGPAGEEGKRPALGVARAALEDRGGLAESDHNDAGRDRKIDGQRGDASSPRLDEINSAAAPAGSVPACSSGDRAIALSRGQVTAGGE